ncbi:alpha-L-rhamnosidase C-terminal domain-containing protein [Streptomyces sp. NPDC001657]|uniref:alpha-L-rhamnosidase C-terminal domain-containing protein n=1 Tax=Streptomyces sp. NPDC001657 TaxID=3154522 RepID=UPI003317C6C1
MPTPRTPDTSTFSSGPPAAPGPHCVPGRADERYLAPYGQVRSCWERSAGTFVLRTTVPWNTTATVFVPATSRRRCPARAVPAPRACAAPGYGVCRGEGQLPSCGEAMA